MTTPTPYVAGYPLVVSVRTMQRLGGLIGVNTLFWQRELSGTRATGGRAGTWVLTPPGWSGELPDGAERIESPTPQVFLLGRFLVDDDADVANVTAISRGASLRPMSTLTGDPAPTPRSSTSWPTTWPSTRRPRRPSASSSIAGRRSTPPGRCSTQAPSGATPRLTTRPPPSGRPGPSTAGRPTSTSAPTATACSPAPWSPASAGARTSRRRPSTRSVESTPTASRSTAGAAPAIGSPSPRGSCRRSRPSGRGPCTATTCSSPSTPPGATRSATGPLTWCTAPLAREYEYPPVERQG